MRGAPGADACRRIVATIVGTAPAAAAACTSFSREAHM